MISLPLTKARPDLKGCPFCGAVAEQKMYEMIEGGEKLYRIRCGNDAVNCPREVSICSHASLVAAEARWQTRHCDEELQKMTELRDDALRQLAIAREALNNIFGTMRML